MRARRLYFYVTCFFGRPCCEISIAAGGVAVSPPTNDR